MKRKTGEDDLDPTVDALVHPGAPAGGIGPGWSEAPAPLGLDFQFSLDPDAPDSPSSLLADGSRPRKKKSPKSSFLRGLFAPPRRASDRNRRRDETEEPDTAKDAEPSSPGRRLPSLQTIREKLGPDGLQAIQQIVKDPSNALTTLQGDILGKIGRYANMGDKSAVRRGVFELVEKLDVTSPKDSMVLVAREKGGSVLSGNLSRELGRLTDGKRSLEMTQGGRVITQLQPVLAQNKAFAWTDGLDRGWQRLNQRFTQQAQGAVDVVVGAQPPPGVAAAAGVASPVVDAPVGSWAVGGDAPPAAGPGPVGSWSAPDPSAAQAPVGQWATPGQAPPGAAADPSARVGSWGMPGEIAKGDAPIGQWGAPAGGPDAAAAGKGASVGAWQMPAGDAGGGAVGSWNVPGGPGAPAAPGADAPIGSWQAPPPDAAGAGGSPAGAVGQWQSPPAGAPPANASGAVGQWAAPAAAPPAGGGAAGATAGGANAPVGSWSAGPAANGPAGPWTQPQDIQVGDGVQLSEILRQNPQLTDVNIVELIQSADRSKPPTLKTVATLARSLFGERFGFK